MAADLTTPEYWETSIIRGAGRLFMLAAIADQPRHGYGIARRIREFCDGCCDPSDAMIYPAIRDLEAAELIACHVDAEGARKRNVCELTEKGREALRVAAAAWARHLPAIGRVV
ncbi:MAG: PadR family transcriptional regulator, partial [Dehalococcoidia bacterium]